MKELSVDVKNILGLQLPSDPRWVNLAELQLDEILTDHAYCEQKAATTCISLITKNSEKELLVEELPHERFLDQMLIMALIEARSCERFKRLSEGLDDAYMRNFYRRFMESEAGHYTLFITLAEHYLEKKVVRRRWAEWLKYEKELMKEMEVRGDRIH
ncbi:MAG: tRNA 2-methylthio-N6-isopentenyl adenosine(37) hydroxylase MiaE [Chitinophagaceae bacterium]|nr:tRNA 2-methylthio-N6-isopentenyl adenosine(37) hydroxylase MiaE [Chitinophagaceae bacterium]